jgi:hypothetical protein
VIGECVVPQLTDYEGLLHLLLVVLLHLSLALLLHLLLSSLHLVLFLYSYLYIYLNSDWLIHYMERTHFIYIQCAFIVLDPPLAMENRIE